jgi:hypothetical protein
MCATCRFPIGPETTSSEEIGDLEKGLAVVKRGVWFRIDAVDKLYNKYKWLLNPEDQKSIEDLLKECSTRSSKFVVDTQTPQRDAQGVGVHGNGSRIGELVSLGCPIA